MKTINKYSVVLALTLAFAGATSAFAAETNVPCPAGAGGTVKAQDAGTVAPGQQKVDAQGKPIK